MYMTYLYIHVHTYMYCTVQYCSTSTTSTTSTKLGEQQVETTGAHHQTKNPNFICFKGCQNSKR